jgi:DNA (cytosine-5)-methyltransferase 1
VTLRIGSLCSGYGGLDLAVEAVFDARTAWFCEYDRDPSAILAHHWPDVPNHGDVKETDWSQVEPVDILTAGYPCQPFSHAGKRKGHDDPRHLWPDVARAIGALRPRLVVLENVRGHVSLGLDAVIGDLSALGYDARWGVVRAADAGAPHGRARIFIVAEPADSDGIRWARIGGSRHGRTGSADVHLAPADARRERHGRGENRL